MSYQGICRYGKASDAGQSSGQRSLGPSRAAATWRQQIRLTATHRGTDVITGEAGQLPAFTPLMRSQCCKCGRSGRSAGRSPPPWSQHLPPARFLTTGRGPCRLREPILGAPFSMQVPRGKSRPAVPSPPPQPSTA